MQVVVIGVPPWLTTKPKTSKAAKRSRKWAEQAQAWPLLFDDVDLVGEGVVLWGSVMLLGVSRKTAASCCKLMRTRPVRMRSIESRLRLARAVGGVSGEVIYVPEGHPACLGRMASPEGWRIKAVHRPMRTKQRSPNLALYELEDQLEAKHPESD